MLAIFLSLQLNLQEEGLEWCGKALEIDNLNIDVLCDRAELYIKNNMFEEAIKDYHTAKTVENHPNKVCQFIEHYCNSKGGGYLL